MAHAMVFLWASWVLLATTNVAKGLGVNWGSQCAQNLPAHIVVRLLKDNGIDKVKLYEAYSSDLKAFAQSGIQVMVGIPDEDLERLSSYDNAKGWVKENVTQHINNNVDIKYVAVGNEPFARSYKGLLVNSTFGAIKNIQKALDEAGHGDKNIKATTPLSADVISRSTGSKYPSTGDFRWDIKDVMVQMVRWFDSNNSPFVLNMNPFVTFISGDSDFPADMAFFDSTTSDAITDKNNTYHNMFDLDFDTLVWALKKAGVPNLEIMVGQIGWPTDGNINANATMAKRFYGGLLKKLAGKEGTPLRPGQHIEAYLFSLLDENLRSTDTGYFERHWGIFSYGTPKFPLDFTGQGREIIPVNATGVKYMAPVWCILAKAVKNISIWEANWDLACGTADCTALTYGSSCSGLDFAGNLSYAFNMYYQMNDQHEEACNFNGLATLSVNNLSTSTCLFPIAVVSDGTRVVILSSMRVAGFLLTLFALLG